MSKLGKTPSKSWRLQYRLHDKENRFSIGAYPDIGLKEARDIALGARRDVANHIAPLKARRPDELVQMRWEDVVLVGADRRYVVSKTKHLDKSKHIVPLPERSHCAVSH